MVTTTKTNKKTQCKRLFKHNLMTIEYKRMWCGGWAKRNLKSATHYTMISTLLSKMI
jgi:hypothetical protein